MRRSFKPVLYREIWKVEVEELDTLAQDIKGLKYSAQAASILDSNEPSISKGMAQLGLKDNQPLVERLDRYNANQPELAAKLNFTAFPQDLKPSPCKPLFFDIVLNHIELPSLDEKLEQNKSPAQGGVWVGSCMDGGVGVKSNSRFAKMSEKGSKDCVSGIKCDPQWECQQANRSDILYQPCYFFFFFSLLWSWLLQYVCVGIIACIACGCSGYIQVRHLQIDISHFINIHHKTTGMTHGLVQVIWNFKSV
ncbi:uncharacterized protein [Apostichopus japonicus]|uniref:uncharacterized protein isoform X2 n=1 Tax=Stichopus japonicus TaxID=307972 RepID=UPI003AB8410C